MECSRCSGQRILGLACAECGLAPRAGEVNSHVVKRRQGLEAVARHIACLAEARTESPANLVTAEALVDYSVRLERAVLGFAEDDGAPRSAAQLGDVLFELREAEAAAERSPALRPATGRRSAILAALRIAQTAWPTFESMLTASSLGEAQLLAASAQRVLAEVPQPLVAYQADVTATSAFEKSDGANFFERTIGAIEKSHPHGNILGLAEGTAKRAAATIGVPVDLGLGVEYAILEVVAGSTFDKPRFNRVLLESAQFAHAHPRLAAVAGSSGALVGLARSRRLLAEAILAFESAIQGEMNEHTVLRRLIKLHGEIYEEASAPLYAWYLLLAGEKSKEFEKLIRDDGANALGGAVGKSNTLSSWFLGSAPYLRNAAQHGGGFTVEGNDVRFNLKSYSETHTIAEVVDMALLHLESLAATSWALSNALALAGVEVPMSEEDAAYMGATQSALASFALKEHGFEAEVWLDGDELHARISTEGANAFNTAIALITSASVTAPVVVVSCRSGEVEAIDLPLDAYTSFASMGGNAVIRGIELRHACHTGDATLLQVEDVQYALGCLGIPLLVNQELALIPLIRRLSEVALESGFDECVSDIRGVLKEFRAGNENSRRDVAGRLRASLATSSSPQAPSARRVTVRAAERQVI